MPYKGVINQYLIYGLLFCISIHVQAQFKSKLSLFFESNSHQLDTSAHTKVKKFIGSRVITRITLVGYCDSIGATGFNDALAQKRVDAVKKQLIRLGVNESLIVTQAKGERGLMKSGATSEQIAQNRRVDLMLEFSGTGNAAPLSIKTKTRDIEIKGLVVSEEQQPLMAEVMLSDLRGTEIQTLITNPDGSYTLKARLNTEEDYFLSYYNDSSFIGGSTFNLSKPQNNLQQLKTVLPKLRGGKNYELQNIHFQPGLALFTKATYPTLSNLYKLMKKNRSLNIQIEGHVNHPASMGIPRKSPHDPMGPLNSSVATEWDLQSLSDQRALAVKNYLKEKGIESHRMSRVGYSYYKMLYPNAQTEEEMAKNRRVEIKVVSFGEH